MKTIANKVLATAAFHNVLIVGCDYKTFGCCGREQYTVVSQGDDNHVINRQNNGFAFTIGNGNGNAKPFLQEPYEFIKKIVEGGTDDGSLHLTSFDIIKDELVAKFQGHNHTPTQVFFMYDEDTFIIEVDDEESEFTPSVLKMVAGGKPRTADKLRPEQVVVFNKVQSLL